MRTLRIQAVLVTVLAAAAVACGPGQPLQVTTIQLGRSLNSDNSVGAHTTRFAPDDTIYVAVLSDRAGEGTLEARWIYGGQVVSEATQEVSYVRESATEFHLQNSGGFPPGEYRVDILLDGELVGSRQFRVQ